MGKFVKFKLVLFFVATIFALVSLASTQPSRNPQRTNSVAPRGNQDWAIYLGDKSRSHYSTLDQINKSNVSKLKVAWTFDTGETGEFQDNPLIVGGVLYTATASRKVIALSAATGEQIWKFDAATERPGRGGSRQRGLAYWASGDDRRIYTGVGSYLYAINAKTGQLVRSFGKNGSVNLGAAIKVEGRDDPVNAGMNSPGVMYKDLYIVSVTGAPGTVQAYDVRTGDVKWVFYMVPRPGEYGYSTWPPDAYKKSYIEPSWAGTALDEERGILYVPNGEPGPEPGFWGAGRLGADLYGNSLVALDANTGKRLWHFQITHHDLLDKDLPTAPVLLTVMHNGRKVDAVAQGTKFGVVFVFDRVTGEPLWPISEKPVPQTTLPGEQTWPTQPFPSKPTPLMRQQYTEDEVSDISPDARALTLQRFRQDGSQGPYPAPGVKETIMFPGFDGGMEWGGAAADPDGVYYVNLNEVPWLMQMIPTNREDGTPLSLGEREYMIQCAACHGLDRRGDPAGGFPSLLNIGQSITKDQVNQFVQAGTGRMPSFASLPAGTRQSIIDFLFGDEQAAEAYQQPGRGGRGAGPGRGADAAPYAFGGYRRWFDGQGYPAIKPPWGSLNAVDLNTGEIKWKVPLGEYAELTAKGIPPTGTENYGGPVVTAGGLIFIGATADETFRAFDKNTGNVLWQAKLPFGGNATPSTYMIDGKQYVVISAGGAKSGRPTGGSIVAFSLP
jgi:quinoprotein glucose dehydrogenase